MIRFEGVSDPGVFYRISAQRPGEIVSVEKGGLRDSLQTMPLCIDYVDK